MSKYLGDFNEDVVITSIEFTTNNAAGGAVAPSSAFEAADLKIYKNGSPDEKTTVNGVTMDSPFDSITGLHHVAIDTSDDTGDDGFWVAGADYSVVLSPDETVDGQTVVAVIAKFSIENRSNISTDDIAALFTGQLVPGVLQNGITVAPGATIGITRGDVKTLTFNLGAQWPLTGKLVYFIIKKDPEADNSTAIVNRLVDTIVDAANGVAQIDLTAAETTPVDCYWYEVELRDDPGNDNPQTPLRGRLSILQDVRQ